MKITTILAAVIALPMLLTGCDRQLQPPSGLAAGDDKKAAAQSLPDKTVEGSPPAAGIAPGANAPLSTPAESPSAAPPAVDSAAAQPGTPKQQ